MEWSQTPRVLLVWPDGGKILRNRLDLVLLERYCSAHGSQLALVTTDPEVIYQAEKVGVPIFETREIAQIRPWRKSFREFTRREIVQHASEGREIDLTSREDRKQVRQLPAWSRIAIFTTALLGVLGVLGMLLPAATIVIKTETQERSLEIPIRAIKGESGLNLSGIIPLRESKITVQDQVSVPATGSVLVPTEKATGMVVFSNLGEEPVEIPEGSVLSTSGDPPIQYLTEEKGIVAGGYGEEVLIPVIALRPGVSGNVSSDEINTIGGSLGANLTASNPEPTSGGSEILVEAPSTSDRRQANRLITAALNDLARSELVSLLNEGDLLLTPDLDLQVTQEEFYKPDDGNPGSELILNKEVEYSIFYIAGEDIDQLVASLIMAQYQGSISQPIMDSAQIQEIDPPQLQSDQDYLMKIKVTWLEQKRLDTDQIIQIALGKNSDQAAELIQQEYDLDQTPEIILAPEWWFRIPVLPFRIMIVEGGA